jgi:hypothetical protein
MESYPRTQACRAGSYRVYYWNLNHLTMNPQDKDLQNTFREEVRAKLFDRIKEKAPVLNKAEILGIMLVVDEALSLQRKRIREEIETTETVADKSPRYVNGEDMWGSKYAEVVDDKETGMRVLKKRILSLPSLSK